MDSKRNIHIGVLSVLSTPGWLWPNYASRSPPKAKLSHSLGQTFRRFVLVLLLSVQGTYNWLLSRGVRVAVKRHVRFLLG